eukprot:TRINITY_DN16563_c0_g2_i1.p1 TRINITY_DN16563_c0_g2~~TRINITY_DN16563_c0_g2_i1.p1  ORF type:complete len:458 (+),score=86.24 TRINITY_DN16563_c0_g2_i1:86-1459(+)
MLPSQPRSVSTPETGASEMLSFKVTEELESKACACPDAVGRTSTSATLPDWNTSCCSIDSLPDIKDLEPVAPGDANFFEHRRLENRTRLLRAEQKINLLQAELDAKRKKVLDTCEKLEATEEQLQLVKQQLQERTEECASLKMALRDGLQLEILKSIKGGRVEPWKPEHFSFVKTIERAPRNEGVVELMEFSGGGQVAVKRMPISRTSHGFEMFLRNSAGDIENPWVDVGIVKYLNQMGYAYACRLLGVFQDSSETYIVSSFATEGDLFHWASNCDMQPGYEREALMRPIIQEAAFAIRALHDLGIAHCDVSAENILLTREGNAHVAVKLIDFSMALVGGQSLIWPRGKSSYQAPEVHSGSPCCPFMYDLFGLGVVTFMMAMRNLPWMSTRPGGCKRFEYGRTHGLRALFKKLKADGGDPTLTELLETTLAFESAQRGSLAEFCNSDWVKKPKECSP